MDEATTNTAPDMVISAHEAAKKLEAENTRMEKNIATLQELKAFEALGGRSEGIKQEVKPAEISPQEYARMVLMGKIPPK